MIERSRPPIAAAAQDYAEIDRLLRAAPSTAGAASPHLARLLHRWSGVPPAAAVDALSESYRREVLARCSGLLDDRPHAAGAHDVAVVARHVTPAAAAGRRGAGWVFRYGCHPSPFGDMLLLASDGAIAGLAFRNDDLGLGRDAMLEDMRRRWPAADYLCDTDDDRPGSTAHLAAAVFASAANRRHTAPLPIALIGSAFDIAVWQALLRIPPGSAVTYKALAGHLRRPAASRAIGSAVGRNPISFLVPCHRVLRSDGALGGYHWGITRKRAMLAWEAGSAMRQ